MANATKYTVTIQNRRLIETLGSAFHDPVKPEFDFGSYRNSQDIQATSQKGERFICGTIRKAFEPLKEMGGRIVDLSVDGRNIRDVFDTQRSEWDDDSPERDWQARSDVTLKLNITTQGVSEDRFRSEFPLMEVLDTLERQYDFKLKDRGGRYRYAVNTEQVEYQRKPYGQKPAPSRESQAPSAAPAPADMQIADVPARLRELMATTENAEIRQLLSACASTVDKHIGTPQKRRQAEPANAPAKQAASQAVPQKGEGSPQPAAKGRQRKSPEQIMDENRNAQPPRPLHHGLPWTRELCLDLQRRHFNGESVAEIMEHHQRKVSAVLSKMAYFGLISKESAMKHNKLDVNKPEDRQLMSEMRPIEAPGGKTSRDLALAKMNADMGDWKDSEIDAIGRMVGSKTKVSAMARDLNRPLEEMIDVLVAMQHIRVEHGDKFRQMAGLDKAPQAAAQPAPQPSRAAQQQPARPPQPQQAPVQQAPAPLPTDNLSPREKARVGFINKMAPVVAQSTDLPNHTDVQALFDQFAASGKMWNSFIGDREDEIQGMTAEAAQGGLDPQELTKSLESLKELRGLWVKAFPEVQSEDYGMG